MREVIRKLGTHLIEVWNRIRESLRVTARSVLPATHDDRSRAVDVGLRFIQSAALQRMVEEVHQDVEAVWIRLQALQSNGPILAVRPGRGRALAKVDVAPLPLLSRAHREIEMRRERIEQGRQRVVAGIERSELQRRAEGCALHGGIAIDLGGGMRSSAATGIAHDRGGGQRYRLPVSARQLPFDATEPVLRRQPAQRREMR